MEGVSGIPANIMSLELRLLLRSKPVCRSNHMSDGALLLVTSLGFGGPCVAGAQEQNAALVQAKAAVLIDEGSGSQVWMPLTGRSGADRQPDEGDDRPPVLENGQPGPDGIRQQHGC